MIIPAFNASATLDAALASVAGQSALPGEVVVVDDGSTDDTEAVARRWEGSLPLVVVRQPNSGTAAGGNAGIEIASADRVAFLDSDDVWLPDHLGSLASLHDAAGGIATADAVRWTPGKGMAKRTHRDTVGIPSPDAQPVEIIRQNFVFIGSLCETAAVRAVGGFRDGFPGAEDWDLWIRLIRAGLRVTSLSAPTVIYRISHDGLTRGTDILSVYERVLEAVVDEEPDEHLRQVAVDRLERARARSALARAGAGARTGDVAAAREAAREALDGPWRSKAEAALVMAAPRAVTAVTDRVRAWRW